MEIMRDKLKSFVPYKEGEAIRLKLHEQALANYKPQNKSDDYLKFLNQNEATFDVCHPQEENEPYYLCLFTVKSQHVYGDCVEECLDKAIAK